MNDRWYSGATRGMWLALAAALLGWMFDGFEMGVFPLVARPALLQLLNLEETDKQSKSLKEDIKRAKAIAESEAITPEDRAIAQKTVDDLTPQHKVLSTQLELVLKWNAVIYAAFLIGAALGGFVFGWIGDRIGRVRAMALSVLIYALFTGLCGLAMEAWHLAALRFIAALGMGGEWALGVALVMEKWPSRSRPVLAGLIGAAANFGFLLTGVIGLTFQTMQFPLDQSWRIILGLCVLPAVLTFFIRMFVPESEKWKEASTSGPKPGLGDIFGPTLWRRSLIGMCLAGIAILATWGGVQMIPQWAGTERGPLVNIWSSAGAIIGSFLGAVIGDRFGRRVGYFVLCLLSLGVCQLLFVGMSDTAFGWDFFAVVAIVGACSAAFYGWLPLYLPELFPTRVRATGQGFAFNGGRMVAAAGVLLTGFAIPLEGRFDKAAAIVCSIYIVGLVVAWFIPETKGQPLPE